MTENNQYGVVPFVPAVPPMTFSSFPKAVMAMVAFPTFLNVQNYSLARTHLYTKMVSPLNLIFWLLLTCCLCRR